MKEYILETCVDSVESAMAAVQGGASRLELCSNLIIGGTTPGPWLFDEIRKRSDIRIHALIRPRFGDFCYIQCSLCFFAGISGFDSWNMDLYFSGTSDLKPDDTEKEIRTDLSVQFLCRICVQ